MKKGQQSSHELLDQTHYKHSNIYLKHITLKWCYPHTALISSLNVPERSFRAGHKLVFTNVSTTRGKQLASKYVECWVKIESPL
jgi:hypothetical protein